MAKAEHLSLEVQCVLGLADEAKKFRERVSSLKTARWAKVLIGGKSPAAKSNPNKIYVGADVEQASVILDAENACGTGGSCYEVEKQSEQSASQIRVSDSNYLLLYDLTQSLMARLATCVSWNGEIEQHLINSKRDVLGNMDALHAKAEKSKITVRESFQNSFALLVYWIQTLFTEEIAAVSRSIDDAGREELNELRGSISECEVAAKRRFGLFRGGSCASQEQVAWFLG